MAYSKGINHILCFQGLSFDAANVVGAEAMKKRRPVSAKKIQQGDTVRARPRSAGKKEARTKR